MPAIAAGIRPAKRSGAAGNTTVKALGGEVKSNFILSAKETKPHGRPHKQIADRFRAIMPSVGFCSLRVVRERSESLSVRQNILQPVSNGDDLGVMLTVIHQGGSGYVGTSDLTEAGLTSSARQAVEWARRSAACSVTDFSQVAFAHPQG